MPSTKSRNDRDSVKRRRIGALRRLMALSEERPLIKREKEIVKTLETRIKAENKASKYLNARQKTVADGEPIKEQTRYNIFQIIKISPIYKRKKKDRYVYVKGKKKKKKKSGGYERTPVGAPITTARTKAQVQADYPRVGRISYSVRLTGTEYR